MASTKAVHERFGRLDPYELARKELFAEGISSSKIYLDPLRPGLEDLLDMITSGVRSLVHLRRRVDRRRSSTSAPASACSRRPATKRARRCRSAGDPARRRQGSAYGDRGAPASSSAHELHRTASTVGLAAGRRWRPARPRGARSAVAARGCRDGATAGVGGIEQRPAVDLEAVLVPSGASCFGRARRTTASDAAASAVSAKTSDPSSSHRAASGSRSRRAPGMPREEPAASAARAETRGRASRRASDSHTVAGECGRGRQRARRRARPATRSASVASAQICVARASDALRRRCPERLIRATTPLRERPSRRELERGLRGRGAAMQSLERRSPASRRGPCA